MVDIHCLGVNEKGCGYNDLQNEIMKYVGIFYHS